MTFVVKKNTERRSFQITIGLEEGYGTNKRHTLQDVLQLIGEWMTQRMKAELPVLTGGMLLPGTLVYAWNAEVAGIQLNQENTVLFVGEVNPLYGVTLTNTTVIEVLKDLAGFLGERLNQSRMYITYMDDLLILQNDRIGHPTDVKKE